MADSLHITPDRVSDLQAALDQSGRTGAIVELAGVYVINGNLVSRGARIRGCLHSQIGDYNVGGTVLHFKSGSLRLTNGPTGNPSSVERVACVFYHQSTPLAQGIVLDAASYGTTLDYVLIDRAGVGITFEPSVREQARSLGHHFNNVAIKSFRSSAIYAPEPSRTSDHYWHGRTWLQGTQGSDYIANPPALPKDSYPTAIKGITSSTVFDNLLIEDCSSAIECVDLLNVRIKDLFVDRCRSHVFNRVSAYAGKHYDKSLRVGMFTAYAAERCVVAVGNPSVIVNTGMTSLALCKEGAAWIANPKRK